MANAIAFRGFYIFVFELDENPAKTHLSLTFFPNEKHD